MNKSRAIELLKIIKDYNNDINGIENKEKDQALDLALYDMQNIEEFEDKIKYLENRIEELETQEDIRLVSFDDRVTDVAEILKKCENTPDSPLLFKSFRILEPSVETDYQWYYCENRLYILRNMTSSKQWLYYFIYAHSPIEAYEKIMGTYENKYYEEERPDDI